MFNGSDSEIIARLIFSKSVMSTFFQSVCCVLSRSEKTQHLHVAARDRVSVSPWPLWSSPFTLIHIWLYFLLYSTRHTCSYFRAFEMTVLSALNLFPSVIFMSYYFTVSLLSYLISDMVLTTLFKLTLPLITLYSLMLVCRLIFTFPSYWENCIPHSWAFLLI